MRLNEFGLVPPGKEGEELVSQHKGQCFYIIFFFIRGQYTWRGLGQRVPPDAEIVGVGRVYYDSRVRKDSFVDIDGELGDPAHGPWFCNWVQPDFFPPHEVVFRTDPMTRHHVNDQAATAVWFKSDRT